MRSRIATACRVLGGLDLTTALYGHVSARVPGTDRILIRARGPAELGVRYTEPSQVVEVDFAGRLTEAAGEGLAAPIEVFIHTEIYKARPDVHAVVHVHPETAVLFTVCDEPLLPLYGAYDAFGLRLLLDGIPTYDSAALIDEPTLGAALARTLGSKAACLMRGHGITTVGACVEEAALTAITLEGLARFNERARRLGTPRPISPADRERLLGPANTPGRTASLWRYYRKLTGADVSSTDSPPPG